METPEQRDERLHMTTAVERRAILALHRVGVLTDDQRDDAMVVVMDILRAQEDELMAAMDDMSPALGQLLRGMGSR